MQPEVHVMDVALVLRPRLSSEESVAGATYLKRLFGMQPGPLWGKRHIFMCICYVFGPLLSCSVFT